YILKSLLLLSFLALGTNAIGQTTKKRADVALGERRSHIALGIKGSWGNRSDMNADNARDTDENTFARVRGNSGLALGVGGLEEILRLDDTATITARKKHYSKLVLDVINQFF